MNVALFKNRVAAFLTRDPNDFVVNGVDNLLAAINDARREAQKRHEFKTFEVDAFVQTSILGTPLTDFYLTPSSSGEKVEVRQIKRMWEFTSRVIAAGTLYERTAEIDHRTVASLGELLPYAGTGTDARNEYRTTAPYTGRKISWVRGNKIHVSSESNDWVLAEIVRFLPDLTDASTEDFFLDHGQEWLLWSTIQIMNGFLKEDQRVAINSRLLAVLWESLTQFDSDRGNTSQANDLD